MANKWAPQDNSKINVASCNSNQILIGTGGGNLIYFEINGSDLKQTSQQKLEHEIACVNINPFDDKTASNFCAVGLWTDISIKIFQLPTLKLIASQPLGGETIPRSILLTSFEGIHYVLCGLGDGHFFSFLFDISNFQFSDKRKISLGTTPISLNTFYSNGNKSVFASSDRPTVIYSSNKKLVFSNVNLKVKNNQLF